MMNMSKISNLVYFVGTKGAEKKITSKENWKAKYEKK